MSEESYDDDENYDDEEYEGNYEEEYGEEDEGNHSFSLDDIQEEPEGVSSEFEVASPHHSRTSLTHSPHSPKVRNKVGTQEYNQAYFTSLEHDGHPTSPKASRPNFARPNFEASFAFTATDVSGLDLLGASTANFNTRPSVGVAPQSQEQQQQSQRIVLLPNNHLPFWGRQEELGTLIKAVERISLEWMENPSEVVWITGPVGVGKSTLLKEATNQEAFWNAFICRGSCEQYSTAASPFRALGDCLNDLCLQLMVNPTDKPIWKSRLEETLGGEGPLVCTICPRLCQVLEIPVPQQKGGFDANTPRRRDRLAFAVRDLLQAVSELHPLVMIVDNIHWADHDSLKLLQDLMTTKPLQNFLLIGIHDAQDLPAEHPLKVVKQALDANVTKTTHVRLQVLALEQVEELLCRVFLEDPEDATAERVDEIQDLAELTFALCKGNPAWMVQLLRLWNDEKLIQYTTKWEWNRKKLKKEIKKSREEGLDVYKSMEGAFKARLEKLPKKILFVVLVLAKLKLTSIPLDDADQFVRVFQAAAYHKAKKTEKAPITSKEELEKMILKACHWGILKKMQRPDMYKFSSDVMRNIAATMTSPYGIAAKKSKEAGRDALTMQWHMGTELSGLSKAANARASVAGASVRPAVAAEYRERYKFLAVEQLHTVMGAMNENEKGRLAKLNVEAAEIAISKTAFQTAIVYLERAVACVDPTVRWQEGFYEVTIRTFLFLARMRLCCGLNAAAMAACEEILENCTSIKDRVYANQVLVLILQNEGRYEQAMEKLLGLLQQMGEVFPRGDKIGDIIEREVQSIRKAVTGRKNQDMLNPKKMSDKKIIDTMMIFANLVEISGKAASNGNRYGELATIRMMHLSLSAGFTRQYPLAFSLFSKMLIERGHVKEAHRLGQVAERIARLNDFYGGEAVALFHWHVSHWRRTYKRSLEPVLQIYNAQVDAGDFCHAGFSISTYIQYHLASGFDLEKLNDNLALFQGLFTDYDLDDDWQLQIPQQAVSSLLGETATPLIFFGVTLQQQEAKLEELRKAGLTEAIQYLHFLRLFVAFFFHDLNVMVECFEKMESPPKGVWTPWLTFFECYLFIQELPKSKGKKRKDLKDKIEELKGQLIDWFNDGAPNCNAMTSILQAEWITAKEAGKGLSSLRAQGLFNDAIEAAIKDGSTHLEAFACERAGQHFGLTGVDGYCTDYLKKSYKAYERCQYIGKVIDLESNYADKLKIKKRRPRPAASYVQTNMSLKPSEQGIGGGSKEVKIPNVLKGIKKSAKVLNVKRTGRKVKNLFKKEKLKAEPAPWGWNSKNKMALEDEETEASAGNDPISKMLSPGRKSRSIFGLGKKKNGGEDSGSPTADPTSSPMMSPSSMKSPSKSPRRPMSGLFGKAKPPLVDEDEEEHGAGESAWEAYDEGGTGNEDDPESSKSNKDKKKKKGGK